MYRIVIADDHALFRRGIKLMLSALDDMEVVADFENGQLLLDHLNHDLPDVVLLDLEMPVMDGKETLKRIRESWPDLPVLLLTMFNNEDYMIHFMQAGASGYLLKNAEEDEVIRAIHEVVSSGQYLSREVSDVLLRRMKQIKSKDVSISGEVDLVERELEVLKLICAEQTTQEIADQLFLSARTIENYRTRLLEKTGARNTAGLVKFAIENKLL